MLVICSETKHKDTDLCNPCCVMVTGEGVTVTTTGPMAVPGTQSNTPLETGSNIGGAVADTSAAHSSHDQSGYEQSGNNQRQGLAGRE
jgi:hypothetical protein